MISQLAPGLGKTDGSRTFSCLWWSYRVTRGHILGDHLAATRDSVGCTSTPYSSYLFLPGMHKPYAYSMGYAIPYSVQAYNKSRYLAVRSG